VTEPLDPCAAEALEGGLGWQRGSVLGVSVHGVLEQPEVLHRLFGRAAPVSLDGALDQLADAVVGGLDAPLIERLALG
jgi:hypothetical protein